MREHALSARRRGLGEPRQQRFGQAIETRGEAGGERRHRRIGVRVIFSVGKRRVPVGAPAAVGSGLIAMALGALVAATAGGGLGTGNGLGGAYVALLLGLIGTALGGRALTRSRHTR
ncbi:DUF6223 family protein [Streptomyces decoyicus]|uniref:DUF6223 family protein n=1 Tax=Streptomyces decoyicus TaxID=249567 RepID=UPI00399C152C